MEEKVLNNRKNGMAFMLLFLVLYAAAIALVVAAGVRIAEGTWGAAEVVLLVLGIVYLCLGWIPFLGLKVLKPQEAMVLTLFGKYVGTIRDDGFYFVNPFCVSVNPAAKTRLKQSGDVDHSGPMSFLNAADNGVQVNIGNDGGKKISLKIMTLNNNRQKINDALGNPVEIAIAVMWRVTDTAKAAMVSKLLVVLCGNRDAQPIVNSGSLY